MRQGEQSQGEQGTWRGDRGLLPFLGMHIAFSINLSLLKGSSCFVTVAC